ncbi:MAG TPA: hypothetical protein VIK68_05920 [Sphingomicrobium sp.]
MAEFQSFRRAHTIVSLALLAVAGCSSKNPDALTGMNLDENAAMMDANASVDANLASANASESSSTSDVQANHASNASANAAAPKPAHAEVSAAHNSPSSSTELNDIEDNQVSTEPDIPNASSNDLD